ncbi:glycosyl transferase [Bacteroidia bacterium]|nr:glycosyl transferase [Bacteroidia bacterium]
MDNFEHKVFESSSVSPLITIVTVVYNSAATLEKTIRSVTEQDYGKIEYIVIDGGSTDESIQIIKKQESNLSAWLSEKDNGIYDAMNKGIRMASGDWVCFLNSGDIFVDSQIIGKVAKEISQSNRNQDVIYGNILVRKADGLFKERIAKEPCNIHRMYFCHQSAFVRRELLQKFGFDEQHPMSADLKFFKQCYYNGNSFVHLNFPVVIYDTSGVSNTHRERGLRDNIAVIQEIDRGLKKYVFLLRLHFVIYWRKLANKK